MSIEYETKGLQAGEAFVVMINQFEDKKVQFDPYEMERDGLSPHTKDTAFFELPPGLVMIQFAAESRIDRNEYKTYFDAVLDQVASDDNEFRDS